jgi:hypothetical protein
MRWVKYERFQYLEFNSRVSKDLGFVRLSKNKTKNANYFKI